MKLYTIIQEYISYITKIKKYHKWTIKYFQHILKDFYSYIAVLWLEDIEQITIRHIIEYLEQVDSRPLKVWARYQSTNKTILSNTANVYSCKLRAFYKYLKLYWYTNIDRQLIPTKKTTKPLVNYVTPEQFGRIVQLPLELETSFDVALRNELFLYLTFVTGCRASEVLNMKFGDIKENNQIQIRWKGSKYRGVFITEWVRARLNEYRAVIVEKILPKYEEEDWIFVSTLKNEYWRQISYTRIQRALSNYRKYSWINFTAHALRHWFATNCLNKWVNLMIIKELLWHTQLSSTQRYLHIKNEQLSEAHRLVFWE